MAIVALLTIKVSLKSEVVLSRDCFVCLLGLALARSESESNGRLCIGTAQHTNAVGLATTGNFMKCGNTFLIFCEY